MSDGKISASASLQSSVGVTSAEELSDKYSKLFSEHSRIKAQHSILKKAVRKEQATNATLQEECKSREQELRASLQQLDLLNFHNERLTKRIQSLQDSGNARISPGWLLGSAKKELEKSKATLEATNIELKRKIEENEKLHKELYEVNSLYTQHVNVLQAKISELEKKSDDLQVELTRSHQASEEALSNLREKKSKVEIELDQIREELRITKALMEKNEQKLKEGDDTLRSELIALRETLKINLGLADGAQSEQFNVLSENLDSESKEIIASFKQLQFSTKEYLDALKDDSDTYELSVKVRNASRAWQKNLQVLATKLTSAQNKIAELAAERELMVKENEIDSNKLKNEISQLREELQKLRNLNDKQIDPVPYSEQNGIKSDNSVGNHKVQSNGINESISKPESKGENGIKEIKDDSDDEDFAFVYPAEDKKENAEPPVSENKESTIQPVAAVMSAKAVLVDDDIGSNGTTSFLALDDMNVRKEDDAKQRENLIKNHYECKIGQLKEQLQLSDSTALRLDAAVKILKSKLADSEKGKSQSDQEISKLQDELSRLKEDFAEERDNHKKSVNTMTEWIDKLALEKNDLEQQITELKENRGSSTLRSP